MIQTVTVMDAQGGGLGRMLIEQLKKELPDLKVTAVGTNAMATSAMLRAGADAGATGENAVCVCAAKAELIVAPIGFLLADAMLGEITERMTVAIGRSSAHKIIIPVNRCPVTIVGRPDASTADTIAAAVAAISKRIQSST